MRLLAIDPGPTESAWVLYNTVGRMVEDFGKEPNAEVLSTIDWIGGDTMAIEMIASYGMAVGASVFETCVWIGRFVERWRLESHQLIYRRDVKLHLCGSPRAKDANIRQAIIDRYGGKEKAIGRKASPGPLYGISKDVWAALGVAITAAEQPTTQAE